MYVRVYICIYVCMHECMYVLVYVYISVNAYMCMYVYVYVCVSVHAYNCVYVFMYVCMYVYIYIYIAKSIIIQTQEFLFSVSSKKKKNLLRKSFFSLARPTDATHICEGQNFSSQDKTWAEFSTLAAVATAQHFYAAVQRNGLA
jgi:hypothetical protein